MFKNNQENFNLLFESVSEGVIVVDADQKIVAVNSSAESMFGYQKDALINESLQILIPSKYHSNHGSHFSDFIKKSSRRKMGQGRDLYGITKNKKEFPLEVGLNPFNMNGKTYIMALVIDITVRKETEKKK